MDLLLASASPRRRLLLERFGLQFRVQPAVVAEIEQGEPQAVAKHNALAKALAVSSENPAALVLGADTVVALEGKVLGKPDSPQKAKAMLASLSGKEHQVITVVALASDGQAVSVFTEVTHVAFRQLSDLEIEGYVATSEPFDKAGGYGIQGFGGLLVQSIKGCYYNVVGLPMPRLAEELRKLGIELFAQFLTTLPREMGKGN